MKAVTDVFLDVDGVLNALHADPDMVPAWGWKPGHEHVKVKGFTICYSPRLVYALNAYSKREDVRFHWLTTWMDNAHILARAIGLDGMHWPVVGFMEQRPSIKRWWKLEAIKDVLETGYTERFVWIDDDLRWHHPARDLLLKDFKNAGIGIGPHPSTGLTKEGFLTMTKFIATANAAK